MQNRVAKQQFGSERTPSRPQLGHFDCKAGALQNLLLQLDAILRRAYQQHLNGSHERGKHQQYSTANARRPLEQRARTESHR